MRLIYLINKVNSRNILIKLALLLEYKMGFNIKSDLPHGRKWGYTMRERTGVLLIGLMCEDQIQIREGQRERSDVYLQRVWQSILMYNAFVKVTGNFPIVFYYLHVPLL